MSLPLFHLHTSRPSNTFAEYRSITFPPNELKAFPGPGTTCKVSFIRMALGGLAGWLWGQFVSKSCRYWFLGLKKFFLTLESTLFRNIVDISGGLRTDIDNDTFKGGPVLLLNRSPKDINFWRTTAVMTTHWHCQFPNRSRRQAYRAMLPASPPSATSCQL